MCCAHSMLAAAATAAAAAAGTLQACVTPLSTAPAQPSPALMTALRPEALFAGEGACGGTMKWMSTGSVTLAGTWCTALTSMHSYTTGTLVLPCTVCSRCTFTLLTQVLQPSLCSRKHWHLPSQGPAQQHMLTYCPTIHCGHCCCRLASDRCDAAEKCTGDRAACPADTKAADGTACDRWAGRHAPGAWLG
jgi:hypothetical protein